MKINKFNIMAVLLSGFLFLTPAAVFAGAESGFYIGGGLGSSTVALANTDPTDSFDFDESDSGYKVFGGFNFGVIPLIDLAVEASYVDFGNPSGTLLGGGAIDFEVTGINAFGLAGLSFGPFGVFAKYGVIDWDTKASIGNDSGTDAAYGIGARFQISSLAIRVEYEEFDLSGLDDLYMASASLAYTF